MGRNARDGESLLPVCSSLIMQCFMVILQANLETAC